MLSLTERALGPQSSVHDNVSFMASVTLLHTMQTDSNNVLIEQLADMIATSSSRLRGLHMLELALLQNPDICFKAQWSSVLIDIIKDEDEASSNYKAKCYKICGVIISILSKDPQGNKDAVIKLGSDLCPSVVTAAASDSEWREAAIECLSAIIKAFPAAFCSHKEEIINIILKQMNTVSCKNFEIYADCFSHIPLIQQTFEIKVFQETWLNQYLISLNTMTFLLNNLLTFEDKKEEIEEGATYVFDFTARDDFENRMTQVRLFINFCRCLAKMLSTNTKFEVKVPIQRTFQCINRLFLIENTVKLDTNSMENQIILSMLSQMQIAGLALLEPLLTNFDTQRYSSFICQVIKCALQASSLRNISKESVSQLRHAVWKLLATWIECRGSNATYEIIRKPLILKELLSDIRIQDQPHETSEFQSVRKSKKNAVQNDGNKNNYVNKNWCAVCRDALKALKNMVYSGASFFSKSTSEDILSRLVNIAYAIHPSNDFPFPYTDERCRKNVYDVLLALTVVCKPDQAETLQFVFPVFSSASRDPSNKVTALCHKAAATCRLALHPKKPPPLIESGSKANRVDTSNAADKFLRWQFAEPIGEKHPNVSEMSNVTEKLLPQISQTFHSESDMHSSDYSQVDAHYSEQATSSQCNGEEMYANASQCQDAEFTDEDEEDGEEDEEEDERSFEEDINAEIDIPAETHVFIPNEGELQIVAPVHSNPETLHQNDDPELEELRPCGKPQANELTNSNKNMQNGVRDSVPDEEMPSVSTQNAASENGIYVSEDEDMEDDDDEEEEEEEEEATSYNSSEKKVPEFIEPAAKKPKMEIVSEVNKETKDNETDQRSRSPTLEEMKADFVFSDGEDVQS